MARRSRPQQIGAFAQRWLAARIAADGCWIARDLSDDFGVDLEAELAVPEVQGEILKLQVKAGEKLQRIGGHVHIRVDRRHFTYAASCRYPLVLVVVDTTMREAWYVWLQEHLLCVGWDDLLQSEQASWTLRIPESQTLDAGLGGELRDIARWRGKTQLVLSLLDALRAAASAGELATVTVVTDLLAQMGAELGDRILRAVVAEVVTLGNRMWGTCEGNEVAWKLFALLRRFGDRIDFVTVRRLVIRGESYSRTGINALGILYDCFPDHLSALCLPHAFVGVNPRVAYYCAFRETVRLESIFLSDPGAFHFAGLRYDRPEGFENNLANRGESALLDYLVPID